MGRSGEMVYDSDVMNENSPSNTSTSAPHHGLSAEAISRRAYELWEQEGRPENRDLHHWLRAEQELLAEQAKGNKSADTRQSQSVRNSDWLQPEKDLLQQNRSAGQGATAPSTRQAATDQPLQAPRGGVPKSPTKRGSASPFSGDKSRATPPSSNRAPGRG